AAGAAGFRGIGQASARENVVRQRILRRSSLECSGSTIAARRDLCAGCTGRISSGARIRRAETGIVSLHSVRDHTESASGTAGRRRLLLLVSEIPFDTAGT